MVELVSSVRVDCGPGLIGVSGEHVILFSCSVTFSGLAGFGMIDVGTHSFHVLQR